MNLDKETKDLLIINLIVFSLLLILPQPLLGSIYGVLLAIFLFDYIENWMNKRNENSNNGARRS